MGRGIGGRGRESSREANKYHEGKVKRTLKRELKVPEIAEMEANGTSTLGEIAERYRCVALDQRK